MDQDGIRAGINDGINVGIRDGIPTGRTGYGPRRDTGRKGYVFSYT